MKLKTYRAPSMAEALTAVKKELGKDAVILHTRAVKTGGFLGLRRKTTIEITAADEPVPTARRGPRPAPPPPRREPPATTLAGAAALSAYRNSASAEAPPKSEPSLRGPSEERPPTPDLFAGITAIPTPRPPSDAPTEPSLLTVRQRRAADQQAPKPASRPSAPAVFADPSEPAIYRELADIKLLVNQVLHSNPASSAGVAAGAMPEALFRHYLRLLESAVSRDIADAIVGSVRDELTPGELHDEAIVRTTVLRHIAELIPCHDAPAPQARAGVGGRQVISLIGPTGVGKTTTIAKLAASYKLRHGKSVALITSDTYRIAAVDQLRTYAGIIGLPLRVVLTPQEMAQAVESLRQYDVVLIDTAGRSQFNSERLIELREFLDAASPTETHLVLSSTSGEAVLNRALEAFGPLGANRVILTKLDEAVNFGVIVNVARRLGTSLSFVTTGQEVPDDIEPGQPDRLARMVLDNALVSAQAAARYRQVAAMPVGCDREAVLAGVGGAA